MISHAIALHLKIEFGTGDSAASPAARSTRGGGGSKGIGGGKGIGFGGSIGPRRKRIGPCRSRCVSGSRGIGVGRRKGVGRSRAVHGNGSAGGDSGAVPGNRRRVGTHRAILSRINVIIHHLVLNGLASSPTRETFHVNESGPPGTLIHLSVGRAREKRICQGSVIPHTGIKGVDDGNGTGHGLAGVANGEAVGHALAAVNSRGWIGGLANGESRGW